MRGLRYDETWMQALPMDYRGIRVWHVCGDLPGNWRELQRRAWREAAPLDALYADPAGRWICARDLAADHWIHAALASDRKHRRRGVWRLRRRNKRSRTA